MLGKYIGNNGKLLQIVKEEDTDEKIVAIVLENGYKKWKIKETQNFLHLYCVTSNDNCGFLFKKEVNNDLKWKSKNNKDEIWRSVSIVKI